VPSAPDALSRALAAFDAAAFTKRHGGYKESLSQLSHEYLLPCPCGSSRLRWNAAKGTWICWGHPTHDYAGRSGDTLRLICVMEGLEEIDAIGIVLDGYVGGDSQIASLRGGLVAVVKQGMRRLPQIQWPSGVDRLTDPSCAPHKAAWEYLGSRGIGEAAVRLYGLGYGRSGKLDGYIIFPVVMDHALVFWQGRKTWDPPHELTGDARKAWVAMTGYKKTLNPVSVGNVATGSEVLFNYDLASSHEVIVICEGPVDAVKVGPHAVALLGKVAQSVKIERLRRTAARTFIIYLDRGAEESANAAALARELSPFASVLIAQPPVGHDAGSLSMEQNAEVLRAAVPFSPGKLDAPLSNI